MNLGLVLDEQKGIRVDWIGLDSAGKARTACC
jgi:hypothetical protein